MGYSVKFRYDAYGRLLQLTNENDESYRFGWDELDRLVAQKDLDSSGRLYAYNVLDEVIRLTHVPSPDEQPPLSDNAPPTRTAAIRHDFERDAIGRLVSKRTEDGTTDYRYDAADNLLSITFTDNQGKKQQLDYTYDPNGQRMSATNLKWAGGWLAAAVLALCWWLPLPFRSTADDGSPRIYGNPEARFTLTLYAELECPHCQAYLPQLQRWIVTNDHVNLAWRHLPLPQHEPAASREARRVECLGQGEGREGVWGAVLRVYLHSQGNGRELAAGHDYPDIGPSLQRCLAGERAAQVVETQKAETLEIGFNATPTLRLTDNHTQHTLILEDPIDPDALLSAVDLLSAPEIFEIPVDVISDMSR